MTRTDDPLDLDRQVCFPLYAASNLLTRIYRPLLAELGLTYPQYLVMLVLWDDAPRSVGDLGARLHLDSGTLTPLLKRLEAAGLVTRTRDARDERRVLVALTPAGRALRQDAVRIPEAMTETFDLTPEAVASLRDSVRALTDTLARALDRVDDGDARAPA